jgi:hypothetical protein
MAYIVSTKNTINKFAAPNLPLATPDYDRQYIDQLNNIFRLYFNQLTNLAQQLTTHEVIPPLKNYTVATLPSASTSGAGARSFVTDALTPTFGATVITGGAVAVPVYSDGTNWKVG